VAAGRPFLASYGGGHAQILIALAAELDRRGRGYDLMGFTTADAAFRSAGLTTLPVRELVDPTIPADLRERAAELAPAPGHPDITAWQTEDYFTVGFADLVRRVGIGEAERLFAERERKAFEPVTAFDAYFRRTRPSIVVSTTSPRFEAAALRAARALAIPTLAIGDMYLIAEQEWILTPGYAQDLTVISDSVAAALQEAGGLSSRLHVLGNPAFDALEAGKGDDAVRQAERERLGIGDRTAILWPLGGSADEVAGRWLLTPKEVVNFLDDLCDRDKSLTYVLRPHPNWPVSDLAMRHGRIDATASLEHALLAADLVCVEASTVGLQAVLRGVPTICYNFADYVLYPDFGWAAQASTLAQMREMILSRGYFDPPDSLRAHVGGAAARIADLMARLEIGDESIET
jgi:hypothetical protein